jgi:DNA-binding NarL/FixJ family response regulator
MIKILIADDHDVMRRGIRQLLETHAGWEICAEAGNGREAVELAAKLKPQVAILDIGMPELNGIEAARAIKKASPRTEILIFTMHDTEQLVYEVLNAGALGYVLKSDASRHLINAVEALAQHKPFFTSDVAATILNGYLKNAGSEALPSSALTPREREVIQLLAEGKSNKEVADALGISVKTAETHRAAIMRKLELDSVADLVRYAIRNDIIQP